MPTALGYEGQCGVMRRTLSRKRLKESSSSRWTSTITGFFCPDCMFTTWSRSWQVMTCVTIASSSRRSLWVQMADPPAFSLPGMIAEPTPEIAWRNSSFPCTSWRQITLLLSMSFPKYLSLSSLLFCEERTDTMRPLVFQVIHRRPPSEK